MTFHEFEDEIRDTLAKYIRDKSKIERYTELVLGLYEEGAEVTSIIRRTIPGNFHETEIDLQHLEEELGDIIWYISHIAMQFQNENLERIAIANLQKINYQNPLNSQNVSMSDYQESIVCAYREDVDLHKSKVERARFFSMGLIKEIGEISTLFGDNLINYTGINQKRVEEKLGDSLWYVVAIAENYGLNLETIAMKNIQKTQGRYDKNGVAQLQPKEEGR